MGEPTLYLFHKNEPLVLSTGQTHRVRLVTPKLESDLPLRQLEGVAKTFERAAFVVWMRRLFGVDVPLEAYETLFDDLRAGSVQMPELKIESSVPRGHLAAYDSATQRILVGHALIENALNEKGRDGCWQLVAVLLEEFGHHVDYLLRNQYSSVGGDAAQDEGAKFAYALLNLDWSAREQAEIARLVYPFGPRPIEGEWTAYKAEIKPWVDGAQQSDQDRWGQYEFFGAGPGKDAKHNYGHSFGHQNIEGALSGAAQYYTPVILREIYFGNWLRDVSQVISPISLKVLSREAYTKILDIKARQMFRDNDAFHVTPAILGVYRAEDHLDNPYKLEDGTADDPDLNKKWTAAQCDIDPDTWMHKHLRTSLPGCTSAFERIQHWLRKSMESTGPERHRHFGAALHAVEDFYAHSNFIEVMLIQLGHGGVYPWTKAYPLPLNGESIDVFPIVTGSFGGLDTAMSLLLELGEDMQKLFKCKPGERTDAVRMAHIALTDWRPLWGHRFAGYLDTRDKWAANFRWLDTMLCESIGALAAMFNYTIGGCVRVMGNQIDDAQTVFLADPESYNPTHSQVAKDHDDHPLHELAARCAMKAVGMLGVAMEEAWREARPIGDVIGLVSSLMVHPDHLTQSSPVWPIRELIADWALNNHAVVARLATRSWVEEASKSKEAQEFRERAAELTKAWDKAAAEAQRARELGLESYARKRALDLGDFLRKAVSDAQSRAVTALVDLHALTQQKKSELTQRNLESALAELHAQFDRQTSALQQQSYASFQQFQRLAEQRYATLTSEKVQAAYREQARLDAEHALQELHAWTDDKLNELQADSKKQRGRLDDYLVSADPIDVVRSKLERIKAAIEASGQSAVDSAKRADKDLRQLVRDIEQELEAPPPESELSALLEREAARLEEKLRAAAEAARGAEDPATKLERETFVKKQLARFRLLLERILDDAQSAPESKQVGQAAGQELDRIREEATKQTHEVARRGPELAGQLKQEVHELTEERQVDAQLDYIAQLKPKTRGIEEGSRK